MDPQRLIAEAQAATGLADFGVDVSFMTGFETLVAAVEAVDPPEMLRTSAHNKIIGFLSARLGLPTITLHA